MNKASLSYAPYKGTLRQQIMQGVKHTLLGLRLAFLFLVVAIPGRVIKWRLNHKHAQGETIWLDDLTFGKKDTPEHNPTLDNAADITANTDVKSRVAPIMKRDSYPAPDYPFAYRNPPVSGNIINGLGEPDFRQAEKVFHTGDYTTPWGGMEFYFHLDDSLSVFAKFLQTEWNNRHHDGVVNPQPISVTDTEVMSEHIKDVALSMGAVAVGITELKEHHLFDGASLNYRYAISLVAPMEREAMLTVPSEPAIQAVMDGYITVGQIAIDLSQIIRAMGWDAKASATMTASEVLHIPIAVDAGVGQSGKHGSLITKAYGSNVRLSTVLTNLPLAIDVPDDMGVDDFCASCTLCVTNCPPHAIFDMKQMVRGEEKWYVDFDKCVPYFSTQGGCGICIEVCPWSVEERGLIISKKMLEKRIPNVDTMEVIQK
ncbi:MAG: 4Fe-4S dicluster domain-containing protein [Chloroflexota bacterium]